MIDSASTGEPRPEIMATRWAVGMRERKLLVGLDILAGDEELLEEMNVNV